jgi:hypothetical protein
MSYLLLAPNNSIAYKASVFNCVAFIAMQGCKLFYLLIHPITKVIFEHTYSVNGERRGDKLMYSTLIK